jgi:hypothetical protein
MKHLVCLAIVFALIFVQSMHAKVPGQSLTNGDDPTLQKDLLSDMSVGERAVGALSGCQKWRVVDTKITKRPKTLGEEKGTGLAVMQWTERWTIDRCGKKVFYTIAFDMRGHLGTIFKFETPK